VIERGIAAGLPSPYEARAALLHRLGL